MSLVSLLRPEEIRLLLPTVPQMFSRVVVAGVDVRILTRKTVLLIGCGGLGCVVAECLARSGIGKMILVDRDVVREENFNRLGFTREDVGKSKAHALAEKLSRLRNAGDVSEEYRLEVEAYRADVVAWPHLEKLVSRADVVLCCVDNAHARSEVNFYCMKLGRPLIDAATSDDALAGRVLTVLPYDYPCYECIFGTRTAVSVGRVERVGACDASLATTMAVVGALQAHVALQILLDLARPPPLIEVSLEGVPVIRHLWIKPREDCKIHQLFARRGRGDVG